MALPNQTVAVGRRAGTSCAASESGKCNQKFAPTRLDLDLDRRLVEALRLAEPAAAEKLVASYGGRAHRLAIGITGNQSDAEEVVQDALWTVVQKIDTFRGGPSFGSWLNRIVANAAYDKLRGRRGRLGECSLNEVSAMIDEHGGSVVERSSRAQDPALEIDLRIVLTAAIEALPEDNRTIVVLREVEGLSTQRIAQITGFSVASVKTRAHRARLALRKRLTAYRGDLVLSDSEYGSCRRASLPAPVAPRRQPIQRFAERPLTLPVLRSTRSAMRALNWKASRLENQ